MEVHELVLHAREYLGMIPYFLNPADPRPAAEQFDANYQHGGGWLPMRKWQMVNLEVGVIRYPGDPPKKPLAWMQLRDEKIFVYESAWVAIVQPNGTFEVARMD
jgi:hypothetical protein